MDGCAGYSREPPQVNEIDVDNTDSLDWLIIFHWLKQGLGTNEMDDCVCGWLGSKQGRLCDFWIEDVRIPDANVREMRVGSIPE